MDKLESSRKGMGQMAMYIYQAFLAQGVSPENAKLYTAQEIEKLYNEYAGQAGINRPLPKRALPLVQELHQYATALLRKDSASIGLRALLNKASELLEIIKKG